MHTWLPSNFQLTAVQSLVFLQDSWGQKLKIKKDFEKILGKPLLRSLSPFQCLGNLCQKTHSWCWPMLKMNMIESILDIDFWIIWDKFRLFLAGGQSVDYHVWTFLPYCFTCTMTKIACFNFTGDPLALYGPMQGFLLCKFAHSDPFLCPGTTRAAAGWPSFPLMPAIVQCSVIIWGRN